MPTTDPTEDQDANEPQSAGASGLSLNMLARTITECFNKSEQARDKANNWRVTAGKHLIEARQRVEGGEAGKIRWQTWCKTNVKRSLGDIRKVLALAGASDPDEAARKQREQNRQNNVALRDRQRAHVSAQQTDARPETDAATAPFLETFEQWWRDEASLADRMRVRAIVNGDADVEQMAAAA